MSKKQLVRNTSASFAQVAIGGLLMFILYRFLLDTIGIEQLGVWSVVLATTSAARIAELGMSGSVVKYVSKYLAQNDTRKAIIVLKTASLSLGAFIGVVLSLVYFPLQWLLIKILPINSHSVALQILPFALVSLWLTALSAVFQSGLDGCRRTDLRALFNILISILTLGISLILVPKFGLLGLAYTHTFLAGLLLVFNWYYLRSELENSSHISSCWDLTIFKEIFRYGFSFQIISLSAVLIDPTTKALLSKYGDLASVGYYEMASRMIMQLRNLLIAPIQVLVPVIAGLHETDSNQILKLYRISSRLQVFLSLLLYTSVLSMLPVISVLWIGTYEWTFILYSILLIVAWLLSGFINLAYFTYLGTGRLKWNMISHVMMGLLNIIIGFILGGIYGSTGVVIAWTLALILGSSVILLAFHFDYSIAMREILPRESIALTFACMIGASAAWVVYEYLQNRSPIIVTTIACLSVYLVTVMIPGWRHPMRSNLFDFLRAK